MSAPESLLDADARQGVLTPATGGQVEDYTGEYFFSNRPREYAVIVRLLADGVSHAAIARLLKPLSRNTVSAIARREMSGKTLEQLKAGASLDARHVAALVVDRARELLTDDKVKMSPRDLGGLAAMLKTSTEAGELLAGQATAIIRHTSEPSRDDFEAALRRAKRLDVDMGVERESGEQSREDLADGERGQADDVPAADGRADNDAQHKDVT